jgi:glycosyltransferase involved in cell wall biosynthesis
LVSIIIPNYNHNAYLKQRIDSVLGQKYRGFEVIILDDASTDNSREIIEGYRDHEQIRHIIYNERNSGSAFKQWRKGIDLAKGDFIWIAESDDYCEPTFLEKLLKPFDNPLIVLSYCQSKIIDEHGYTLSSDNLKWTDDIDNQRWRFDFINSGKNECKNYLSIKNTIPNASAVIFRKDVANSIDWNLDEFRMAGDWMFWIKLLCHGDISYLAESLNSFRLSPNNTRTHNSKIKKLRRIKEELWIISFLKKEEVIGSTTFRIRMNNLQFKAKGLIPRRIWNCTFEEIIEYIHILKCKF